MGKKRFNGYHWDPFLHEIVMTDTSEKISLENYGMYYKLTVTKEKTKVLISSLSSEAGFFFENGNTAVNENSLLGDLVADGCIDEEHKMLINQNTDGLDLDDRIEKLKVVIEKITG